jgi:hypothetical protein
VQAPHNAMPQPNFVPVIPSVSRKTHSNGIFGLTFTDCGFPFSVNSMAIHVLHGRIAGYCLVREP